MCGISGWFLRSGEAMPDGHLHSMADAIAHRGPDDRGYYFHHSEGVALAHNRLSIIDLSPAGHQPMISDDGNTVLIYNGELYNFLALKEELIRLGHSFHSRSDSEVILQAFIEWGPRCVERFAGMFAFAIWSARDHKLFLARDALGMKPLYYAGLPGNRGFVFASEIKAFLSLPGFSPVMNRDALRQFLEFGYTFSADETSLEGVSKLPPGHSMEVIEGRPQTPKRFFFPPESSSQMDVRDREAELYETLSEVVDQHLIADVPVGLLLSGGLDSSITAALAA